MKIIKIPVIFADVDESKLEGLDALGIDVPTEEGMLPINPNHIVSYISSSDKQTTIVNLLGELLSVQMPEDEFAKLIEEV